MATHTIGILVALGLFRIHAARTKRECMMAAPIGAAAVGILALIQILGPVPATHRVDQLAGSGDGKGIHMAGEGRLIAFLGGHKSYRVKSLPHIGNPDAKHVLVKYFDYTCESCGKMDAYLESAIIQYPDDLAVILLPSPLNRSCNKHLPVEVQDHAKACEFAKYALAVWRADSKKFVAYHHWLFKNNTVLPEVAKAEAIKRVGEDALEKALADNWGDQIIKQNCDDYKQFIKRTPVMPKLLLGGSQVLQGASTSKETFIRELEKNLRLAQ